MITDNRVEAAVGKGEACDVHAMSGEWRVEIDAHIVDVLLLAQKALDDELRSDVEKPHATSQELGMGVEVEPQQAVPFQ